MDKTKQKTPDFKPMRGYSGDPFGGGGSNPHFEEMLVHEQMMREGNQRHRVLVREREEMSYCHDGTHRPYSELTRTREMTPTEHAISKLDTRSSALSFLSGSMRDTLDRWVLDIMEYAQTGRSAPDRAIGPIKDFSAYNGRHLLWLLGYSVWVASGQYGQPSLWARLSPDLGSFICYQHLNGEVAHRLRAKDHPHLNRLATSTTDPTSAIPKREAAVLGVTAALMHFIGGHEIDELAALLCAGLPVDGADRLRPVAEIMHNTGVSDPVVALVRILKHSDKVRQSVAETVAKLGTPKDGLLGAAFAHMDKFKTD